MSNKFMSVPDRTALIVGGKTSMLGQNLASFLKRIGWNTINPSSQELDITNIGQLDKLIGQINPTVVFNCAAILRDRCKVNPVLGYQVNVEGTRNLVNLAKAKDFILVFFSSNAIFTGCNYSTVFKENTLPCPENIYAEHKLEAEKIIREELTKYYIIRFSLLFGPHTNPVNFVSKVLAASPSNPYHCSNQRFEAPTYAPELAKFVHHCLDNQLTYGIYHAFNPAPSANHYPSRFALSSLIAEKLGLPLSVVRQENSTEPYYSILSTNVSPISTCFSPLEQALEKYCDFLKAQL